MQEEKTKADKISKQKKTCSKASGRPRSEESKQAILEAATQLMEENGYCSLTIEAIAKRAKVGKMTIYRWWKSKEDIIMDIFLEMTNQKVKFEDNVSLHKNFIQIISNLMQVYQSTVGQTMLRIIAFSEADSEVYHKYEKEFLEPKRRSAQEILQSSKEQGHISKEIDIDLVLDMVFGPIYVRMLIYKEMPTAAYQKHLVDYLLGGIECETCDI